MSLNQILLIGNAGRDAELRYTASGRAVAGFSIAVNRRWMSNNEWQEETEWFNVSVWGQASRKRRKPRTTRITRIRRWQTFDPRMDEPIWRHSNQLGSQRISGNQPVRA